MMKYLGVDYGDKRTGLARSDATGLLASGIGTISPGGMDNTAQAVAQAAKENGCGGIVVGLPRNMDGSEGFRAEAIRAFVELLRGYTDCEIFLYDERLSTMEAHRILSMSDVRGAKRKKVVDTLSAQIILQDYLDSLRAKR